MRQLRDQYGPLLFHQSGGCCEGSAPMCLRRGGFRVGARDVLLGVIEGCPFYVSAEQFPYWAHSQLTIDVVAGGGDSFSLEAAEGVRFITRSRVFSGCRDGCCRCGRPISCRPQRLNYATGTPTLRRSTTIHG